MKKDEAYVGQRVTEPQRGAGTVQSVDHDFAILVKFDGAEEELWMTPKSFTALPDQE